MGAVRQWRFTNYSQVHRTLPTFTQSAQQLEHETLCELQAVIRRLDRAVEAVVGQDECLATEVRDDERSAHRRHKLLKENLLAALGSDPAPSDLQMLASLLHVVGCVRRIDRQCASMARLAPTARPAAAEVSVLPKLVEGAASLSVSAVWLARAAFASRDLELAHQVVRLDAELTRRGGVIFRRALELTGAGEPAWAMSMLLVGSYAERVGDAAVDIAEQAVTLVNGVYREVGYPEPLPRERAAAL